MEKGGDEKDLYVAVSIVWFGGAEGTSSYKK